MTILKIIFYGLLAFIERHPIFSLAVVLLAIFAPVVFKAIGWIIVAAILLILLVVCFGAYRLHKMRREMENQFRNGPGAGFGGATGFGGSAGGFTGFGNMHGMSLEELVRQMQEQANARKSAQSGAGQGTTTSSASSSQQKRVNDKVGDYVDFEEVE